MSERTIKIDDSHSLCVSRYETQATLQVIDHTGGQHFVAFLGAAEARDLGHALVAIAERAALLGLREGEET